MSGRRSRGWEAERAILRRSRGSSPRSSRRSRSTSRGRRRSPPRRFRRSPSGDRRRPLSGQDGRIQYDPEKSVDRERFLRNNSRETYERPEHNTSIELYEAPGMERYDPERIYEIQAPSVVVQRFSPPPVPPTDLDISFQTPATPLLDNEDTINGMAISSLETIPEFDPESSQLTAREWIRIVDAVALKKKWTKEEKKYHMSQKLVGVGRQWYLATNKLDCTWNALKSHFIAAFPSDMDYCSLLQKMFDRRKKKDESYATYFTQKVGLLENCGITGAKAVSCIIGGLPPTKVREVAFRQYFRTVDALYEFLREEEKKEAANEAAVEFEKKENAQAQNQKRFNSGAPSNIRKQTKPPPPNPSPATKVMFGALGKVPTSDKYFVDVQVNGTLFKGYIDFKSAVCTIREETAKFAGLDYQRCYESVMGFNGYSVSTVGQVKAAIAVDQGLAIIDVYICPDHIQAIPVVIGQSFLRRPDILVMQDNRSINIYQQGEHATFPTRALGNYPFPMQGNYIFSSVSQRHYVETEKHNKRETTLPNLQYTYL